MVPPGAGGDALRGPGPGGRVPRRAQGGLRREGGPALKPQDGGYDAFDGPQGDGTWYAAKGPGFVAFGPDETLIAAVARPGEESLEKALTPALARPFLAGDVGLYVNAAALSTRYADQIDQARQGLMAALDQAGQQMGNAASMDAAKMIYGGLFDALKDADALTLDLDFAAEGLHLAGALAVKADSDAAKAIAASRTGTAADLGKFPADSAFYVYMNMDAKSFDRLQGMGMRMLNPGGKATPALGPGHGPVPRGRPGRVDRRVHHREGHASGERHRTSPIPRSSSRPSRPCSWP